jgi:hypothetical protein
MRSVNDEPRRCPAKRCERIWLASGRLDSRSATRACRAACHAVCFLLRLRSVRWVAVGPGGGVCGAVARTKRRSDNIRALAVVLSVPLRRTAFTSAPAESAPRGPRCAWQAAGLHPRRPDCGPRFRDGGQGHTMDLPGLDLIAQPVDKQRGRCRK